MTMLWPNGIPMLVRGKGATPSHFSKAYQIVQVCNRWRIHTRWWERKPVARHEYDAADCEYDAADCEYDAAGRRDGEVDREYVKLLTQDGTLCLLYRDHVHGGWFLARV
jgi:hypothetical protein